MIIDFIVAFFATVSFSVLFNIPRQQYIYCGITGAVGWIAYLLSSYIGLSAVLASFVATAVLTYFARMFSVYRKTAVTVFLIAGLFPLVPGSGIYYTAYYFVMGENQMVVSKGVETVKIAIAIALGIVCISALPNKMFAGIRRRERNR